MRNLDLTLLYRLLAVETESGECDQMQIAVAEIADEWRAAGVAPMNWEPDNAGNLWLWRDDAPAGPAPWIVAHMDTVHPITGNGIHVARVGDCLTGIDPVTMEQTGIGGDDKCGVYAALHLLRENPAVRVLLTVDEETGGHGAYAADLAELRQARFILQADRRGGADFVRKISGRTLASDEFESAVASLLEVHGFRPCDHGGFTDIGVLVERRVGVSVANLSAGYHNPHRSTEYIDLRDLSRTVALMADICAHVQDVYPHLPPPPPPPPTRQRAGEPLRQTLSRRERKLLATFARPDLWECWGCNRELAAEAGALCPDCDPSPVPPSTYRERLWDGPSRPSWPDY
jgi:hypothetical protein